MDVKDLRTESALSERNNDGSKYTQGGIATLQCNRNKPYQDIGSNPLAKAEGVPVRPCAVIGPDRVVPPPASSDAFLKKGSLEPWVCLDNGFRRPPDYPHRLHQNPARNISPRQTFQENMQRINVPPSYNAVRHSDSANVNHIQDRSVTLSKNAKPNMAPEAKYCDVPYALNTIANDPKNVRDAEMYVSSVNPQLTRSAPHVWPPSSVNVNVPRTYSVNEPYQYPQYSCAGPRPIIPMTRPHRPIQEDPAYAYPDHYYRDAIGRLKHYPPMKEGCPQPRYEYVGNYSGQFHPPAPIQPIKYDIPKSSQTHPYPVFPHFKYLDNRVPDPTLEGYQRSTSHQPHFNIPYRTQVIHPTYAQVPGNTPQKVQSYPPDASVKAIPSNKLHYDNSSKMYIDYENARNKPYPMADNYYVNDMNRFHPLKNQMVMPNYSPVGMHPMPSQQYYIKDNTQMKPFEYMPTFRSFEPHMPGNPVLRHAPQFSPNTLAISPTDSNTSNDASQAHGALQEDYGYGSQSSTTSVRSVDSGIYRLPHEYYKRPDFRYGPIVGSSHTFTKTDVRSKDNKQKQIDVRQFLQMWNEGEDENNPESNNGSKEIVIQTGSSETGNVPKHANNEDQLYVLGLVNVPSEELSKYEHIEKISKLPENIKGYNNLELFSRFEEAMESCKTSTFKTIPKEYQNSLKENTTKITSENLPRPVSPLDVEAKISQSVIHKEVGCNFEIKPCSPKMLNVEVAAPAQNILGERVIEKVSNPLSKIVKSPLPIKTDENSKCNTVVRQDNAFAMNDNPSCKMIRSPFASNNMDSVKTNYTLQDLEINSGVCLASLPRLDNEIELNFPEVNQQFINANKKDGVSSSNNYHEINMQKYQSLSECKDNEIISNNSKIISSDCDKQISKLSKYRKSKSNTCDNAESKIKAIRTDSVIIKNPENIKNIESKILENNSNAPMNLSSQSNQWYNSPHEINEDKDNDIALDFSLNKSVNDLPIIEPEKESAIQPFEIDNSHEDVLYTAAKVTYQKNTHENDIAVHSNDIINESFEAMTSNDPCVQTYQDSPRDILLTSPTVNSINDNLINLKNDHTKIDPGFPIIQKSQESVSDNNYDFIGSTVKEKTVKSVSLPNSVLLENTKFENSDPQADGTDSDLYKVHDPYKDDITKKSPQSFEGTNNDDTIENPNEKNEDKFENILNYCENNSIPSITTESSKENEHAKQIVCQEKSSEVKINAQIENYFEHDEISANLEKLFRESNDEILPPKNEYVTSNRSLSKVFQNNNCHQSKELYSPWIQKLITYSEGSCTHKKPVQKVFTKSIFDPIENSIEPAESDIELLKKELSQDLEMGSGENIVDKNKEFTKISLTSELTSDIRHTFEHIKSKQPPIGIDSIKIENVLILKKESEVQDRADVSVKEHEVVSKLRKEKSSYQSINYKKRSIKTGDDSNKRKSKKRKVHSSKLARKISYCDSKHSTNLDLNGKIDTRNFKNDIADKLSETISNRMTTNNLECIAQRNISVVSSEEVFVVSDDKKDQTKENAGGNELVQNTMTKDSSNTHEEALNTSNTDLNLCTIDQSEIKEPDVPVISRDTCSTFELNERQRDENFSTKNTGECVFQNCIKDPNISTNTFDSYKHNSESLTEPQEQEHLGGHTVVMKDIDNNDHKITTLDSTAGKEEGLIVNSTLCEIFFAECSTEESNNLEKLVESHERQKFAKDAEITSNALNITGTSFNHQNKNIDAIADSKTSSENLLNVPEKSYQVQKNQSDNDNVEILNNSGENKEEPNNSLCINTMMITTDIPASEDDENNACCSISTSNMKQPIQKGEIKDKIIKNINSTVKKSDILDTVEMFCESKGTIEEDEKDNNKYNPDSNSLTENDNELCEARAIPNTSENTDIISKDDTFLSEDRNSVTSDKFCRNSLDVAIDNHSQENKSTELNVDNEIEYGADVKNISIETESVNDKKVNSGNREIHMNIKNLRENSNSCAEPDPTANEFNVCTLMNSDISQEQILEVCPIERNDMDCDIKSCNSNLKNHSTNVDSDCTKLKSKDASEGDNNHKSKVDLKDINTIAKSSNEDDTTSNDSASDTLANKSKSDEDEVSNCISKEWIDINEPANVLNVNDTATNDDHGFCEDRTIMRDPDVENNLGDIEDRVSIILDPETCTQASPVKRKQTLKRSFSDSALNNLRNRDNSDRQLLDNTPMWPPKRQKIYECNDPEQQAIDENFCNFIQNRRNSISSYYNAENVSFCILIDNDCILTEENEENKVCFAEVSEDCITAVDTVDIEDNVSEGICAPEENELDFSETVMLGYDDEKTIQGSWLDDVACVETVVSDDIVDVDDEPCFSTDIEVSNYEESGIFNSDVNEITLGENFVNDDYIERNISEFENTSNSPSANDNILYNEQPRLTKHYNTLYNGECLEKILSESYHRRCSPSPTSDYADSILLSGDTMDAKVPEDKENICVEDITLQSSENTSDYSSANKVKDDNIFREDIYKAETSCSMKNDNNEHLPESNIDNVYDFKNQEDDVSYSTSSSSPEVSSTTFEEKSSILLKITNYNGSRVSEINEVNRNRPRCKFTESKDYSNSNGSFPKRPLITKAAQKYIPPLKESIRDLKVKLPLPQQKLLKLKQLKQSKTEPKVVKPNILMIPKKQKPKPNFEDVLKNIDEVQIKMHKQNSKKTKNFIPKVVIKKNINGSHYTSSSSKEKFNPDLTGRKWQPWVFLERNSFINSMAMTNKTKAIFSHRKNTYVLAEKFKKYKSVSCSNKFIISQPKTSDSYKGHLKYTIRLKHSN